MKSLKYTLVAAVITVPTAFAQNLPQSDSSWYTDAQKELQARLALTPNTNMAKNVILFVADGQGVSTVTAARILEGQLRGITGEENMLSFENMPHLALSKTYNSNAQVADSAGTAVAMVTGVKTKQGVLAVNDTVLRGDCAGIKGNEITTALQMAEKIGMSSGVVSTARITHATPAAMYSHAADRNWEDDSKAPEGCEDIASSLIKSGVEVAMGGGRRHFISKETADPEDEGKTGKRKDGRDLTAEWTALSNNHAYIWDQKGFDALDTESGASVLGLFDQSHMEWEADRANDASGEPSLAEMTGKAIDILDNNENGYFLMVEGGRVDHAHHAGNAYRALYDSVAFHKAVQVAMDKTSIEDTLIIVTADHSHVFTIAGYAQRGNPILGLSIGPDKQGKMSDKLALGSDEKPYTTLGYGNGPGGLTGPREDLSQIDTQDKDYVQQATVPRSSETHGGEDVAIYASGPWAHLFQGTVEQNYIFHVMNHAAKLTERAGF